MNKVILHISDLHISNKSIENSKSWLSTQDYENSGNFIEVFYQFILTKFPKESSEIILLITGDITDVGDTNEFETAKKLIQLLKDRLSIDSGNCLLIPGDHDINKSDNELAYSEGRAIEIKDSLTTTKKPYEYKIEKLKKFSDFYRTFYNEEFNPNKIIFKTLMLENEKIILLGINSTHKIDFNGGKGYIDCDLLHEELEELTNDTKEYSLIACFHHNLVANYEMNEGNIGQWEENNQKRILRKLDEFNIKLVLTGNEHTHATENENGIYMSDSGMLSTKEYESSFKSYLISSNENKVELKNKSYILSKSGNRKDDDFGRWVEVSSEDLKEPNFTLREIPIEIKENPKEIISEIKYSTDKTTSSVPSNKLIDHIKSIGEIIIYKNEVIQKKLYEIVQIKKLFHSGHFHWSETSRAHNWINTSKLLYSSEDLLFCKKAIIDVIETCSLEDEFDFIIGLGMEGNMLSTKASYKYQKDYTYLPYSYRYDEHNNHEKDINFINNDEYKRVLIITDVVHDGRTLRKLIHKRNPDFFEKVEKIIVISLFYSGDKVNPSIDILNSNKVNNFDPTTDHSEDRIEYYFIKQIKVESCPYSNDPNYKVNCAIVNDELDCIHSFYREKG